MTKITSKITIDKETARKYRDGLSGFIVAGPEETYEYELLPLKEIRDLPQFSSTYIYFKDKS